ncbi:MAG: UvrD-helicase domain-containing protein [Bacilli bacterium]|nr:UvrD-helicase domain-containing protein [Bacilli bacterium]
MEFFKKIENDNNIKLDDEQRRIVLNDSQNCLVVAGAGCGKTTLITIKTKYLVEVKNVNPQEILVISFTNESVNDLKKKIILDYNLNVDIMTFHKLGLNIIGKRKKIKVLDNLYNVLNNYFLHDIYFTNDYLAYLEFLYIYIGNQKLSKIIIEKPSKLVNSLEELAIIKFLELTNLKYKYHIININYTISEFIFKHNGVNIKIRYLSKLKRKKLNTIDLIKGTNVLMVLYTELNKLGLKKFEKIETVDKIYNQFIQLCYSFINNYKVNYNNIDELIKLKEKHIGNRRIALFLNVILEAYMYYNNYNKKNSIIDFNDMINQASSILKDNNLLNYKYVIIDEFQDISKNRFEIIKILSLCHVKIIAFGDDWQAIFGFAGSNVNIFLKFENIMANCKVLFLTKTYRNSQQLIDVVGDFIMKNHKQIKKKLLSSKRVNNPVNIYFYDEDKNKSQIVYDIICDILRENPNSKILLIGRYKFELLEIIDKEFFDLVDNKIICLKSNINMTFLTAHSSKGLTYDDVIVLNANNDIYGFPSQVVDDYEIAILKEKESFGFEEERRLFYVALTRTKNRNYILADIKSPSYFVLEIIKNKNVRVYNLTRKKVINNYYLCQNCGYFVRKNNHKRLLCANCKKEICQ